MGYYPRMMHCYLFFEDLQNEKSFNNNPDCSDDTRISLQLKSMGALRR